MAVVALDENAGEVRGEGVEGDDEIAPPGVPQEKERDEGEDGPVAEFAAPGFPAEVVEVLRVAAALLPGGAVQFVVTYHHIILDAWSVALLFAEFRAIWRGCRSLFSTRACCGTL